LSEDDGGDYESGCGNIYYYKKFRITDSLNGVIICNVTKMATSQLYATIQSGKFNKMSHDTRNHFLKSIVAGGGAGLIEVMIMYPLDLVKTQMQLNVGRQVKMGTFTTLGKIFKERGPLGLYRGIASPILAEVPKRAIKFGCNELYKPIAKKHIKNEFLANGNIVIDY
jgi:hypothetical protein